jgi:hypothetical protein
MAHIDLDHGAAYGQRPAATSPAFQAAAARVDEPGRVRTPPPSFCRINVGQIGRSLFLVLICVGFWQSPHPERLAPKSAVATPALKPF